ncbi:recombinase family protein [Nocardiopsis alkaliphila]|uniref:recombinase family protein n=1 Tax=Nocardiopsis alkaliphila TaxID=225762 RepID=UPI0012696A64|nr:recombinase family protein [Nocardiopsis alkaliphila]
MSKPLVIIYVRLSPDSDASTSVESQTQTCRAYPDTRGWQIPSIAEDVDVSGASRLIVHVLSAFAEYERDMIRTRILENKVNLRAKGRWSGGAAPYGYKIIFAVSAGRRDEGWPLEAMPGLLEATPEGP